MAIGGDDEAWYDELWRQHWDSLVTYAYRLLWPRCRQDAEDAVQQAFERAWAKRRRRPPEAGLLPWLLGFVFNCVREKWGRDDKV
ncbi:MAG TPA: sigma factor, partial [Micromonosporaceae bacterium]|nr:sigma factor [Micromonosporaceae bacterium]